MYQILLFVVLFVVAFALVGVVVAGIRATDRPKYKTWFRAFKEELSKM